MKNLLKYRKKLRNIGKKHGKRKKKCKIEKNHEKILADQTKSWVDQGKITSLWTNNLTLVQMSKLLFDEAWSESYKVVQ